jgi:hypothetical protein
MGAVVARMDEKESYRGWDFWLESDRVGMTIVSKWQGNAIKVLGKSILQPNKWYHVAVTYDGSFLKQYVNGNLDGSAQASGPLSTGPQPLRMGCTSGGYFFNGRIDELSLYNRALGPTEIQRIFAAGSAGKCFAPSQPVVTVQPTNETVVAGGTATFYAVAAGTPAR